MKIKTITEPEMGENTYIIERSGKAIIIDPGCPYQQIADVLQTGKLEVQYILLTHGHVDHILSANEFPKDRMYAHELEAQTLRTPSRNVSVWTGKPLKVEGIKFYSGEIFGLEPGIKIYHTPGHTPGGVIIQMEDALFTGDTLFEDTIGRTDLPGGDPKKIKKSLEIFDVFDKNIMVYPGHGEPFRLSAAYKTNFFLYR